MKEKVIIISNFYKEIDNSRGYTIYKFFKEAGYETKVICSDFSHSKKIKEEYKKKIDLLIIKTKKYKRNISLKRIYSHVRFSIDVVKKLKKEQCDLVYVILPPNILGYLVTKYCKKKGIKVITDIIDLWPEALPIPNLLERILDKSMNIIWKKFREKSLERSNYILTESNYFYKKLRLEKYNNSKIIYLKKIGVEKITKKLSEKDLIIRIGYLGNIGAIYDFEGLIKIANELSKFRKVVIEIIGVGEKEKFLKEELKRNNIKFKFHGIIYNEERKKEILSNCDFGFNGYKNNTEVALSYKSIDYFSYGIPILNSAKGDTWDMILEKKVGINYDKVNEELIYKILSYRPIDINRFFLENFSYKSLVIEMTEVIKEVK